MVTHFYIIGETWLNETTSLVKHMVTHFYIIGDWRRCGVLMKVGHKIQAYKL